jgi:hypothetical protein
MVVGIVVECMEENPFSALEIWHILVAIPF